MGDERKHVERKQPETLRLRSVMPSLTVNDAARSLAWYRDVMGFFIREEWTPEGKLAGGVVQAGDVLFFLTQDDFAKGKDRRKGEGMRLYCSTGQEVDGLAEQMKGRGAKMLQEPKDQPWGGRDFTVEDPDGFKITISNWTP